MRMQAPNSTARRLPIFVTAMVCTFFVNVLAPEPVPQKPAKRLVNPSSPMLLLTTPGGGARDATRREAAWYAPTCKKPQSSHPHLLPAMKSLCHVFDTIIRLSRTTDKIHHPVEESIPKSIKNNKNMHYLVE